MNVDIGNCRTVELPINSCRKLLAIDQIGADDHAPIIERTTSEKKGRPMTPDHRSWTLEVLSDEKPGPKARILESRTVADFTITPEYVRDCFKERFENPDYPEARRRLKPGAIIIRDENGEERIRYTQTDYFRDNPTA